MENPLKKKLKQKIEEVIQLLELRMLIQTQSVRSNYQNQFKHMPADEHIIDRLESTYSQNIRKEEVINEWNEQINKLILLQEGIPTTDIKLLLQLFDNYRNASIDQFYEQLKVKIKPELIS